MSKLKQATMIDATESRENRFSGESILLTKHEAKIHDEIFYYEYLATLEDKKVAVDGHSKLWDKVRKDINWFRQHNARSLHGSVRLVCHAARGHAVPGL